MLGERELDFNSFCVQHRDWCICIDGVYDLDRVEYKRRNYLHNGSLSIATLDLYNIGGGSQLSMTHVQLSCCSGSLLKAKRGQSITSPGNENSGHLAVAKGFNVFRR